MPRFVPYRLGEQAGEALLLYDAAGTERRAPLRFVDVALPGTAPRWAVTLLGGAWVTLDDEGAYCSLPAPTADNDLDALTLFLAELRRCGVLFDQLEGTAGSVAPDASG